MALIVEDGSGLVDAEAYLSVADAAAYHLKMGNRDAWALVGNEVAKEAMLRQATEFMRNRYLNRWIGRATVAAQRLDWPRVGAYTRNYNVIASTLVPEQVKNACAELALKAASGELMPDSSQGVKREVIGPIEVEYDQYSSGAPGYPRIDAMLAGLLVVGGVSGPNMPLMRT